MMLHCGKSAEQIRLETNEVAGSIAFQTTALTANTLYCCGGARQSMPFKFCLRKTSRKDRLIVRWRKLTALSSKGFLLLSFTALFRHQLFDDRVEFSELEEAE